MHQLHRRFRTRSGKDEEETPIGQWLGLDLIDVTSKLEDVLHRNGPTRALPPIEMTQADWRYGAGG